MVDWWAQKKLFTMIVTLKDAEKFECTTRTTLYIYN